MKNYLRNQNIAGCLERMFAAVSFAEQGEFETARELVTARGRGESRKTMRSRGRHNGTGHEPHAEGGRWRRCLSILLGVVVLVAVGLGRAWGDEGTGIRVGFFPNITHSQALLAKAGGDYEKATGRAVQWTAFNAGPSAIEALFAGAIDMTFIGPNPAINGYLKSQGKAFVIVAGGASGGAALVVRGDAGIQGPQDFGGKVIATPQLGNTQDVAARAWLRQHGYTFKEKGGNLTVMPLANPDQLTMFQKREIDGAWTIEPWVSRLLVEGGGRVLLEEKALWPGGRYVTTHLIVSREFLQAHATEVKKILHAHVEITRQMQGDIDMAMAKVNEQIRKETGKALPEAVLRSACQRVEFTWDPVKSSLKRSAQSAFEAGFMKGEPNLEGIYDLRLLNEVLGEKGLARIL